MKQALNLWKSSALDEVRFVELMQEARRLTHRYQNRPTWDPLNNKMAYYFATLKALLFPETSAGSEAPEKPESGGKGHPGSAHKGPGVP